MMPRFAKPIPPAIRNFIEYNPETGVCTWRRSPVANVPVGSVAGGIDKSKGYLRVKFCKETFYVHRIAWFLYYNEDPPEDLDHRNGVRTDNRLSNLRSATRANNTAHRTNLNANNTSGVNGVYWHKKDNCWVVSIRKNSKSIFYGSYETFEIAEKVAIAKKKELLGEYAGIV